MMVTNPGWRQCKARVEKNRFMFIPSQREPHPFERKRATDSAKPYYYSCIFTRAFTAAMSLALIVPEALMS